MLVVFESPSSPDKSSASVSTLLLRLSDEVYGLPGAAVREVMRHRAPLPVPGAPPSLPGLISQRGIVLPVVDLRPLLGLPYAAPGQATRYVVVRHEDVGMALLAERVIDLVELPLSSLQPLPAALDPVRARLLRSLAEYEGQLLALLDLAALVSALREGA